MFVTENAAERFADLLAGAPTQLVTERAAKALSDTVTPVGLVAVCTVPDADLEQVLADGPTLVAVPVGVSEPGNAGTIIRVADAMGADAVVLAGPSVDPYNGKCLRASAGSIFSIPVIAEPDTDAALTGLRDAGLQVLATVLDGSVSLDDVDLARPTAWLFGPEAHGLPPDVVELATARVRIPMAGNAESLNIGSAAAICLYQSARASRRR